MMTLTEQKTKKKLNDEKIVQTILGGFILVVIGLILYTNTVGFCSHMNADLASDTILAKVMSDRGEWIPSTWYIANEVRLFCTPNLASLVYEMTQNLQMSTGIACFIMTLLIVLSTVVFLKRLRVSTSQMFVFLLLNLVLANHFVILELQYLWASYYSCHIVLMFLTLAAYYDLVEHVNSKTTLLLCLFTLLGSFCMGAQSERGLLIVSVPLLGTEMIRMIYQLFIRKSKGEWKPLVYVALLVLLGYVGTLIPLSIAVHTTRNIRHGFSKFFGVVLQDAMHSIGYYNTGIVGKILLSIFLLLAIVQIVWHVSRLMLQMFHVKADTSSNQEGIPSGKTWILCFFTVSPIVSMLAASFTTTDSSERYYFVFLYLMSFAAILFMEDIPFVRKMVKNHKMLTAEKEGKIASEMNSERENLLSREVVSICIYVMTVWMAIINIGTVYIPVINNPKDEESPMPQIADYLEVQGFKNGYATFEYATPITVFSQGNVWICPVATVEKMNICKWMTCTDWFVPNAPVDQQTVYIIKESEMDGFQSFLENSPYPCDFETQIGEFYIYSSPKNGSCLDD